MILDLQKKIAFIKFILKLGAVLFFAIIYNKKMGEKIAKILCTVD
jgi:hypothetical protein